jgi:tRNA (adenine37-N6)-methyltransferase
MSFTVHPVGTVVSGRVDPANTDHWGAVVSTIEFDERFGPDSLAGLTGFSHVEVLFVFDQTSERTDYTGTRSPRGRSDLPAVGVFAERGPRRPNRIGATICEVVDVQGPILRVLRQFLPAGVKQPDWVDVLMQEYFQP